MEAQRDIAFKIVYFFIAFITFTFGLLYAYYKVDKKEQEQEQREKRAKGVFYGEATNGSFFDFLAGQMDDQNFLVNPHARHTVAPKSVSMPKRATDLEALSDFDKSTAAYYQQ